MYSISCSSLVMSIAFMLLYFILFIYYTFIFVTVHSLILVLRVCAMQKCVCVCVYVCGSPAWNKIRKNSFDLL